jgi:hypothetical protein
MAMASILVWNAADQHANDRKERQRDGVRRGLGFEFPPGREDPDFGQKNSQNGGQQSGPETEKQRGGDDCGIEEDESREHKAKMRRQGQMHQQRHKNQQCGEKNPECRLKQAAHFAPRHETFLPEASVPPWAPAGRVAERAAAERLHWVVCIAEYMGAFPCSSMKPQACAQMPFEPAR